jgi:hypothetical protein
MKKERIYNYQKRAYRAECTQWTGDNLPEVSAALLDLGYDDIDIERGTVMARGKGKPLLCVHKGNWLRFGEDDSFKVMRPTEFATYVPIQSDDELRAENDSLREEVELLTAGAKLLRASLDIVEPELIKWKMRAICNRDAKDKFDALRAEIEQNKLTHLRSIAEMQLEYGLQNDALRAELNEITCLRDMIIQCGEDECREVVGYPQKLRVLIDGLITVRRERDTLRVELDALKTQSPIFYGNSKEMQDFDPASPHPTVSRCVTGFCCIPMFSRPVPAIPAGMELVPKRITQKIVNAIHKNKDCGAYGELYDAILTAAQKVGE